MHADTFPRRRLFLIIFLLAGFAILVLNGCGGEEATPTIDPDIYNQVPDTTVFEAGQCTAVLDEAVPAFTSNTLASGQPSGEIPAGEYEVGVAADYGSTVWFGLNGVGTTNYINSDSVMSLEGDCELD